MSRILHCLDSRLTDGGKVVSPTHWQRSTPQKHHFSAFCTHFCYRLSEPRGLVLPEGSGNFTFSHFTSPSALATDWDLSPGFDLWQRQELSLYSTAPSRVLGLTQSPTNGESGVLSGRG
jgi:hypothetical protein